jgi:hypothetical protein
MADLTYNDIAAEIAEYGDYDVAASALDVRKMINMAVRYIGNWMDGRWNDLYIRDYATTFDATGRLVTFPSELNILKHIHRTTLERNQYRRWIDYDLEVEQPATAHLTDAPTRKANFYYVQTANGDVYLSYWRKILEFNAATDQVPDLPGSGEAILEYAKYLILRAERTVNMNEKIEQQTFAMNLIRDLWGRRGVGYDVDNSAPVADVDIDAHMAMTNYDIEGGGDTIRGTGPIMDRNYGG